MLEKGCEIKMKDCTLALLDTHEAMIAKVIMIKNKMFLLNIETDMPKCLKACVKDETWFWHVRLGHISSDNLKMMAQKKMLKGLLSIIHLNLLCERCLMGKQFYKSFLKESTSRASQPLQEIYADICGPIQACSFGKKNYIFNFLLMIIVEEHGHTS
jgi:hypothetical protein